MVVTLAWVCIGLAVGIAAESVRHIRLLKEIDALQIHRTDAERLARDMSALEAQIASLSKELEFSVTRVAEPEPTLILKTDSVLEKVDLIPGTTQNPGTSHNTPPPKSGVVQAESEEPVENRMPWDIELKVTPPSPDQSPSLLNDRGAMKESESSKEMPWDIASPAASSKEDSLPKSEVGLEDVVEKTAEVSNPTAPSEKMPWDL